VFFRLNNVLYDDVTDGSMPDARWIARVHAFTKIARTRQLPMLPET
jgi:hypothetical protein